MAGDNDSIKDEIDRLGELFREDPEGFETLRKELIERTIEAFPEHFRPRAYGIQFQLDATLGRYRDPVARMNKMVEIFWEQFRRFHEAVSLPQQLVRRQAERRPAKLIPLHGPKKATSR